MVNNREQVDEILRLSGFWDYKWVVPQNDIIVAQWVRFHCQYGCDAYGKVGSCPPAVPPVDECRKMINEYDNAIILHFPMQSPTQDDKLQLMSALLSLEREVFLAGYHKAFLLQHADCGFCKTCVADGTREKCVKKAKCRPSVDAMGIDIFQTVRNAGYTIQVLKESTETQNRFAILLVD